MSQELTGISGSQKTVITDKLYLNNASPDPNGFYEEVFLGNLNFKAPGYQNPSDCWIIRIGRVCHLFIHAGSFAGPLIGNSFISTDPDTIPTRLVNQLGFPSGSALYYASTLSGEYKNISVRIKSNYSIELQLLTNGGNNYDTFLNGASYGLPNMISISWML